MTNIIDSVSENESYLAALRELQLHDNNGIVLPDGWGRYRFGPAADARSRETNERAKVALRKMRQALSEPSDENLQMARRTVLKGNPKLLGPEERAEYTEVIGKALNKVEENLSVIDVYSKKVGGRQGALQFIERLKDHNPVDFLFTQEDRAELDRLYPDIVKQYLAEKGLNDKKNFTIEDTRELNRRIGAALGNKSYRMLSDPRVGARIIGQAETIDADVIYEAKLAQRIYPTLDRLFAEGRISKEKPIYLVELGNNCAQNNMQTYLIWKVVNRWFDERGIDKTILKPVQLTSFGGHPQTATFDAHIEVEESIGICRRCQALLKDKQALIFNALEKSIDKLSPQGQEIARKILQEGIDPSQRLEELLQNDLTRPIFRLTVGTFSRILPPETDPKKMNRDELYNALKNEALYFFRGEGESSTHTALMLRCGDENIPIRTEDVSTNTGENILLLELEGDPVVIPVDFCPVGRQVVTSTYQVKKWSTVLTSLIDLPISYYSTKLRDEQLFVETASYFAELARNILYRTVDSFVSAFPIDDANYQLLWDYYAALKGYTPEEAAQQKATTSIKTIFETVKNAFVQFENTIPHGPVMERNDPKLAVKMGGRLQKYYAEMQARGILTSPTPPPVKVGGPLIPVNKVPKRLMAEVRTQRKKTFYKNAAFVGGLAAIACTALSWLNGRK